jgi:hypothetical protein
MMLRDRLQCVSYCAFASTVWQIRFVLYWEVQEADPGLGGGGGLIILIPDDVLSQCLSMKPKFGWVSLPRREGSTQKCEKITLHWLQVIFGMLPKVT